MRLIDADAVAEVLNDEITYAKQISASSQTIMGLKMGLAYINTAEPVDAVPVTSSWVTDRHPTDGEDVLITFATGEIGIGCYNSFDEALWRWSAGEWNFGDEDIVAWMPLPGPYVREGERTDG